MVFFSLFIIKTLYFFGILTSPLTKTSLTHCPSPAQCPPCPVPSQPWEQSDQRPIFTDAAGDWGGRGHPWAHLWLI